MRNVINQFPTVDTNIIQQIGIKEDPIEVKYSLNRTEYKEIISTEDKRLISLGLFDYWDPTLSDVIINRTYTIAYPWKFYGQDGIIPNGADVGIASEFLSASSRQRFIFKQVSFSLHSQIAPLTIKQQLTLPKNSFRGIGKIVDYVYLAKESPSYSGRKANKQGLVLGNLFLPIEIAFDGIGSLFPAILGDLGSDGPLWKMRFNSTDPIDDDFIEDNICIIINKSHKYYKDLKIMDFDSTNPLKNEMFAGWIGLVFSIIEKNFSYIYEKVSAGDTEDFGSDSIAKWLFYIKSTFSIDLSKPENMMGTLNSGIHKLLG